MVAQSRFSSKRLPVALLAGTLVALIVAATVLSISDGALVTLNGMLTLDGLTSAGSGARLLLAAASGAVFGSIAWSIAVLTVGTHLILPKVETGRRALWPRDEHADLPARRPIRAAEELGSPLGCAASVACALPVDLEQPLAAYDPVAIPDVPRKPVRPVSPLVRRERLETFTLTPDARGSAA